MTLTLTITNRDRLENGSPRELVLHRRGAVIGRAQTCDWALPDSSVSGRHCEIKYADQAYTLVDVSRYGTFLNGETDRMSAPWRIRHGDGFFVGVFEVEARLSGEARAQYDSEVAAAAERASQPPTWSDWDDISGPSAPAAATAADPFTTTGAAGWDLPAEAREGVSAWADRAGGGAHGPSADQIFSSLTDNHKVDWASAAWDVAPGFDPFAVPAASTSPPSTSDLFAAPAAAARDPFASPAPPAADPFGRADQPAADPFGGPINPREQAPARDPFAPLPSAQPAPPPTPPETLATRPLANRLPSATNEGWPGQAGAPHAPAAPTAAERAAPAATTAHPTPSPAPAATPDAAYRELIAALGISSATLTENPEAAAARAGRMLRRLLAGLMILLEARARAKDEMGASATQLRFEGNNPLKFARNVEQALQMMMNPAMQGYMEADSAIEDSYRDLQAHQIATLRAMQGALRATLQRFSPAAIKNRAGEAGLLAKIVPGQREAALWRAYEKQFSGVAEGSAEAFLDIFSKEFRQAYEEAAHGN